MSRFFNYPSRGKMEEYRDGVKRSYGNRGRSGHASHANRLHSPTAPTSNSLYANGWIPPGSTLKRPASPSYNNYEPAGPNKVARTGNKRSSSTSSLASSASSSPSMSYNFKVTVPNSSRHASTSAVETRTRAFDTRTRAVDTRTRSVDTRTRAVDTRTTEVETRNRKADMPKNATPQVLHSEPGSSNDSEEDGLKNDVKELPSNSKTVKSPTNSKTINDKEKTKQSLEKHGPRDGDSEASSESPSGSKTIDLIRSDELSRRIWSYYIMNKQTKVEEAIKEDLRLKLQSCINQLFPYSVLILGGSSLNGFGHVGCDADMCLYVSDSQVNPQDARRMLVQLRNHLQHRCSFISHLKVIFAKVPILKFNHRKLECDLNINHHTGVRNTLLLQLYSRLDWRVAPLVMFIKQWAKNHGINDASQGTLSSYSYVLMIINYLQVGCNPPVLKSIQSEEWGASIFAQCSSMLFCWNKLYDSTIPQYANQSANTQDLYSLLKGFFAYYANFDFESTVVCVRLGSCFPTSLLPPNHPGWKQKFIFIEEPFDRINTARSVFEWMRFRTILETFDSTHEKLCKSNSLDIDDFLNIR